VSIQPFGIGGRKYGAGIARDRSALAGSVGPGSEGFGIRIAPFPATNRYAMPLQEYKKKRAFASTPEPKGGKSSANTLQFVVQKHAASRLHYDFRLEMGGVLKSWAVPKGPSLNPADKRLAMQVEDHPFDYKDFEGIIPAGNYGAGTVMVWDEGTYESLEETNGSKAAQNRALLKQLREGSLKFRLNGKKLKGEFALVHTKGREENAWLLIKHRDRYATEAPVTDKDRSVVSKKTMEEIAGNPRAKKWESNKGSGAAGKAARAQRDAVAGPKRAGVALQQPLLAPGEESKTVDVNKHPLTFTHLSKVYWPKDKYTKRDLLNYYYSVAPYILPYLKDRPQSLNRHPNGITGPSFYQKNVSGKVPDWIKTFPYRTAEDNEDKEFLVCTDEASLLYIISLGCIEVNPWSSRVSKPDNPDWCIIDLDPDKKTPFDKVIEAAQVTKSVLNAAGIESRCKTSGSTGLHVYFPLGAKYSYEHSKEFARLVVQLVQAQIPDFTTIERSVKERKGRMYLDFLQNRPQATIAAPYSVRPKPGATVSAPLHWEEVKKGLSMQDFTIRTMGARIREVGDLFQPVLGKGIDMQQALKKLEAIK
jgi:DNA ligase D-like protein (predicted polymerase)/DNA ligase D-like protein (predicted 3'-phosphoesterase)